MSFRPRAAPAQKAPAGRLDAVLRAGLAQRLNQQSVPTEVKRKKDGSFVLSPDELRNLLEAKDQDDVPLHLQRIWKGAKKDDSDSESELVPLSKRRSKKPGMAQTSSPPAPESLGERDVRAFGRLFIKKKAYLITSDEQKRIYVRFRAVREFARDALRQFYDEASQSYGDVVDGDWEAEGIKPEDSLDVQIGNALLESLETQWEAVKRLWESQGINVDDALIFVHKDENDEKFDKKYKSFIDEYSRGGEVELSEKESSLNEALDRLVVAMLTHDEDDED